jgi:hypothetical protein
MMKNPNLIIFYSIFNIIGGKMIKIPKSVVLTFWDIGCLKWNCIFFSMVLGAFLADFTKQYAWIFVIAAVILTIKPIIAFLRIPLSKE